MAEKKSKNLKNYFFGGAVSALVLILALIFIFGDSQNNFIAESAENIFYDQFFKKTTDVEDSVIVTVKGANHFNKTYVIAATDLENFKDKHKKDSITITGIKDNNDSNIIIADIDEKSLQKLGSYYNWDRSIHAKVIDNLSEGGAAAIAFDILFKDADFGKNKGNQCYEILSKLHPDESPIDSIREDYISQIRSYYNYDSMLVDATQKSNICIVSFLMNYISNYRYESDWKPLSTWDRAKEIGFASTFQLNQVDKQQEIVPGQLLDNVFPELANAGTFIGAVNAYPDQDGTIRSISMFYKFPYVTDNTLAPQRVYSTLSLMTILHLFHKNPKDVQIRMGQYIDVGQPFGIYRDSVGTYHTTFPNFTYPMFMSLRDKMKQIKESGVDSVNQVRVSSKVTARRNEEGRIVFDVFTDEDFFYNAKLSSVLRKLPEKIFKELETNEKVALDSGFTLSKSEEDEGVYTISDEDDNEVSITPNILSTIHFFEKNYRKIHRGEHQNLSRNMDIRYNKRKDEWFTSIGFFTNAILKDILNASDKKISSLKLGEEMRFGPYKKIPIGEQGGFRIKYKGRFNKIRTDSKSFKHVSYYDLYTDTTNLDQYAGKTAILGSSVPALFDIVNGPHEEDLPAILVHANIIKNILEDDYLTILEEKYQCLIIILLAVICTIIGLELKGFISLILALSIVAIYTFIAFICFKHNIYIGVSRQILTIITSNTIAMVIQAFNEYLDKKDILKEKTLVTNTFKRFMSPKRIDKMLETGNMPQLGGEESIVTAYFTDIQGFSTFSEKIGSASNLVKLLNEYLNAMTDILVNKNEGTLDKYEGDAIIAFFENSEDLNIPNQAKRACDTALDMQNELLRLRQKWQSEGEKWPKIVHEMHMRIGINTGSIVTGNMGSNIQMNYTMMGDEVNLAARLESAAKQYGAYIQVSQNTMKLLKEQDLIDQYIYRTLDIIRVVGKDEPVRTFELLAYANDENALILNKLTSLWENAREAYLAMEWDKAIELFTQCLDFEPHLPGRDPGSKTCPSQVFINRCIAYKQNPPANAGEQWDGIFTATEK